MRYVKNPKPVKLGNASAKEGATMSLVELVRDILGSRPEWRADDSAVTMYLDIVEALEAGGDYIKVSDEQHEKMVASFKGFEPGGAFVLPYMRLMRSVTSATKSLPESTEGDAAKPEVN